jgi:hypothetical protein
VEVQVSASVTTDQGDELSTIDRLAIQELLARYSWAIDLGQGEDFAATFTPDGTFDSPAIQLHGRDELQRYGNGEGRPARAPEDRGQHWLTNIVLAGTATRASLKAYLCYQRRDAARVIGTTLGYYQDELVKHDGQWRFAVRRFRPWPPAPPA